MYFRGETIKLIMIITLVSPFNEEKLIVAKLMAAVAPPTFPPRQGAELSHVAIS